MNKSIVFYSPDTTGNVSTNKGNTDTDMDKNLNCNDTEVKASKSSMCNET